MRISCRRPRRGQLDQLAGGEIAQQSPHHNVLHQKQLTRRDLTLTVVERTHRRKERLTKKRSGDCRNRSVGTPAAIRPNPVASDAAN